MACASTTLTGEATASSPCSCSTASRTPRASGTSSRPTSARATASWPSTTAATATAPGRPPKPTGSPTTLKSLPRSSKPWTSGTWSSSATPPGPRTPSSTPPSAQSGSPSSSSSTWTRTSTTPARPRCSPGTALSPTSIPTSTPSSDRLRSRAPGAPLDLLRQHAAGLTRPLSGGCLTWKRDRNVVDHYDRPDAWSHLPRISVPTLIVRGAESTLLRADVARRMRTPYQTAHWWSWKAEATGPPREPRRLPAGRRGFPVGSPMWTPSLHPQVGAPAAAHPDALEGRGRGQSAEMPGLPHPDRVHGRSRRQEQRPAVRLAKGAVRRDLR